MSKNAKWIMLKHMLQYYADLHYRSKNEKNVIKKVVWPGSTQLAPVPAVLVACGGTREWKPNLITIAWAGVVCIKPPMVSIAIRPERYSYAIIKATGEFSINLPAAKMVKTVDWCGVVSGRDHDKFAATGLTPMPGSKIGSFGQRARTCASCSG